MYGNYLVGRNARLSLCTLFYSITEWMSLHQDLIKTLITKFNILPALPLPGNTELFIKKNTEKRPNSDKSQCGVFRDFKWGQKFTQCKVSKILPYLKILEWVIYFGRRNCWVNGNMSGEWYQVCEFVGILYLWEFFFWFCLFFF